MQFKFFFCLSFLFLLCTFSMRDVYCQIPQVDVDGVAGKNSIQVTGGENGLVIQSPVNSGIVMNGAGTIGLNMFGAGQTGINIIQTGGDGMYMFNMSGHGINMDQTSEDGFRVTNAGWRGGYFSNMASSTFPAVQIQAGSDANMDVGYIGHARIESDGSFVYYLDQNGNSSSDRFLVVNSDLEDVFEVNESGIAIIQNRLDIPQATGRALVINDAGDDGIVISDAFDSGINVFNAGGHGGYFQTSSTSPNAAIEAQAGDDNNMDIRLNGHGRIASGGHIHLYLDDNNNGTNDFTIYRTSTNPQGPEVFSVSETGQVHANTLALGFLQTTPTGYALSVDGKIIAEEVVVQLTNNWPDYVFDESYSLMPLSDLASFIEKKRHLPNVPAARQIENEGLSVGEIQRIQMEKIEELTLYILELHKEISALKTQMEESE